MTSRRRTLNLQSMRLAAIPVPYDREMATPFTRREPEPFNVRVPKTAELVARRIRRQIVTGELKEGDALPPESQLMADFTISRPTLREAFRILESEALITVRRGARG